MPALPAGVEIYRLGGEIELRARERVAAGLRRMAQLPEATGPR